MNDNDVWCHKTAVAKEKGKNWGNKIWRYRRQNKYEKKNATAQKTNSCFFCGRRGGRGEKGRGEREGKKRKEREGRCVVVFGFGYRRFFFACASVFFFFSFLLLRERRKKRQAEGERRKGTNMWRRGSEGWMISGIRVYDKKKVAQERTEPRRGKKETKVWRRSKREKENRPSQQKNAHRGGEGRQRRKKKELKKMYKQNKKKRK